MGKVIFSTSSVYGMLGSIRLDQVLPKIGILFLIFVLTVFFGLLAITANPVFISIGVGLLLAPLFLAKPDWNIWIILVIGLLVAGVLPLWVDWFASKVIWVISLLSFVLMFSALFRAASTSETIRSTPAFVWLALIFMTVTVLNSLAQWSSLYEFASGLKRYFQAIGLLFALAWLGFNERQVRSWRVFFIIVAITQLPWAIYQLVDLVPMREGIRSAYPGMVPIDIVAGTFGSQMYSGGASAEMATFLIVMLAFLLSHRREKLIGLGNYLLLLPFVLLPLFMGETKVVVLLLPMMFFTLYRRDFITRPHHALLAVVMCALIAGGAGYAYFNVTKAKSLDTFVTNTLGYNVYEKGRGNRELNRTTVLTFWTEQQGWHDPASTIFGSGLGAVHDRTGGSLLMSKYDGYGIGLTAISTLLWEQGIFGTALFLSILIFAWRTAGRLQLEGKHPWMRADAAAIQAALPLFAFYLFYRNALLEMLPFQIFFYSLLGYLAWLHYQHAYCVSSKE
jgi:hypothetical protein